MRDSNSDLMNRVARLMIKRGVVKSKSEAKRVIHQRTLNVMAKEMGIDIPVAEIKTEGGNVIVGGIPLNIHC